MGRWTPLLLSCFALGRLHRYVLLLNDIMIYNALRLQRLAPCVGLIFLHRFYDSFGLDFDALGVARAPPEARAGPGPLGHPRFEA